MIIYTESENISEELFNQLSDQDKKYLISTGVYKHHHNYLFSLIYQNTSKKNIGFLDALLDSYYKQPYIALAVLPEYRRKHIAEKMLQSVEEQLKLKNYNILYYTINNTNNLPSISFALKHGFQRFYQFDNLIYFQKYL